MKMKLHFARKLMLLLVLCSLMSNAQNLLKHGNEKTYREYMDKVFDDLIKNDKKDFKNKILYDRVPPIAKLVTFNSDKSNTSNYSHFVRAWEELYQASDSPEFNDNKQMIKFAESMEMKGLVELGLINADFTSLDSLALSPTAPLLELKNGKLHKIKNKQPYINNHVLVVSPLNLDAATSLTVNFEFGKIWLDKSSKKIKNLSASFEGNQKISLIENGKPNKNVFKIKFLNYGKKKIDIQATFNNGEIITTSAEFYIQEPLQGTSLTARSANSPILTINATKPYQGYDEDSNCGGNCFGQGEYQIFYSGDKLLKPFVIVDGFDPNDKRKIMDILGELKVDNGSDLKNKLIDQGFDVVVLNFPKYISGSYDYEYVEYDEYGNAVPVTYHYDTYRDGGTDYIQRNAKVVEALLDKLNAELQANGSSSKIKIAGPSMGALIVQYALKEMEKNNEKHNANLFVSFDGPHKGANFPLGAQKAASYFNIGLAKQPLESPAAKEMLINHYLANSENPNDGAPNFRDRFQNELNDLGFPTQSRNIACINGSVLGEPKSAAGENMLHADLTAFAGFLRRIGYVNYTPDYGRKGIFRYLKLNWFGGHVQDEIEMFANTDSTIGSIDNAPGGYLAVKNKVEQAAGISFPIYHINDLEPVIASYIGKTWACLALPIINIFIDHLYLNLTGDNTFVPTKSSLAFKGNPYLKEKIGCRNLVCTGETPFDSYYAPANNQEHASLHQDGVDWLMQEILDNPQAPTVYDNCGAQNLTISGKSTLCDGNIEQYNVNASCYNKTVTWEVSSNLQVLNSNGNSITVKSLFGNDSNGWIKANLSDGQVITKNLTSIPSAYAQVQNSYGSSQIIITGYNVDVNDQNITNIIWEKIGGDGILNASDGSPYASARGYGNTWYLDGKATLINQCGSTDVYFSVSPDYSDPCSTLTLNKVAPNEYQIIQPCDLTTTTKIQSVEMFDIMGQGQTVKPKTSDIINLDGKALKGSIQLLKIKANNKTVIKRIKID